MTFGASDAFATSEYVLLEGKEIPQLNEVCIFKLQITKHVQLDWQFECNGLETSKNALALLPTTAD